MANIWSSLFGGRKKEEERLTVDEWAQYFKFNGNSYPFMNTSGLSGTKEAIENDYAVYIQRLFKSNPIVYTCCTKRMKVFTEMRFQFQQMKKGKPGDLFGTDELSLLENPWPNGFTGDLLARAIQDADLSGNHYVVREGKRLRRLRPDWVEIVLSADPEVAVAADVVGYIYKPGNTEDRKLWKIYPITGEQGKIAHWSPVPDPEAQYRGMSWMTPVLREIAADSAATEHKESFYHNAATPNISVSFKETVTAEQFKEFMEAMEEDHTGPGNAYKTLYVGGGADVTPLTHDFAQLDFKKVQGAGETRIAAASGIHPVVAGLSEGMQGAGLNAGNFKSARDAFADMEMRPMWRTIAAAYSALIKVPSGARLWYDDRDVAFLQDDVDLLAKVASEEATIVTKLTQDGFKPESIVEFITKGYDWSVLKHTGLYSVQLQPPMPNGPPVPGAAATAPRQPTAKGRPATGPTTSGAKPTPLQNKQKEAQNKAAKAAQPAKRDEEVDG